MPGAQQPPDAGTPVQGQGQGAAEQAIQQVQSGFMQLGKMIKAAGQNIDPQDVKLFQGAVQATDAFIQAITGEGGGQQQGPPQKAPPSQPMPANANAGAKPAPQY